MDLNLLNGTAPEFLEAYAVVGPLAVLLAIILRARLGSPPTGYKELNVLELACLSGHAKRMGETLLTALLVSNAISWSEDKGSAHIRIEDQTGVGAIPWVRDLSRGNVISQLEFRKKLRWLAGRIENDLLEKGYSRRPQNLLTFRLWTWPFFIFAGVLAIVKASLGQFLLLVALACVLGAILSIFARQTPAVRNALHLYRTRLDGLARPFIESELPFAVALTGVKALSGTGYGAMYAEADRLGWTNIAYRDGVAGADGFVLD